MEAVSGVYVSSRFFPRLVRDVNNATMMLNDLKYTMVKGKLMMDKYPMRLVDKSTKTKSHEQIMARLRVVSSFLQSTRTEFKVANEGKKVVHHKSLVASIDDAKAFLLKQDGGIGGHNHLQFVSLRGNFMSVYSGRPRQKLRRLMEDFVCREHGLRTKSDHL